MIYSKERIVIKTEEKFHDEWAASTDVRSIDIMQMNEEQTAPEMRFIRNRLGDLRGKKLLDVGCGLGEAAVYFAMQGAEVTAMDISQKMLDVAMDLALYNHTKISVIKWSAEKAVEFSQEQFDIIYAGNFFHHVNIYVALQNLKQHLKPGGILVSWDPVVYNPAIMLYRKLAKGVRTADEHPLSLRDIRTFKTFFSEVECRWFWLTTLLIFFIFAFFQWRNPSKVRYWKKVVEEGKKWEWLYRPLERLDTVLLKSFPFLRFLCWNVVIFASGPKGTKQ